MRESTAEGEKRLGVNMLDFLLQRSLCLQKLTYEDNYRQQCETRYQSTYAFTAALLMKLEYSEFANNIRNFRLLEKNRHFKNDVVFSFFSIASLIALATLSGPRLFEGSTLRILE